MERRRPPESGAANPEPPEAAVRNTQNKPSRRNAGRRAFVGGFAEAWAGVVFAFRTQRNLRFHLAAAVLVLTCGVVLGVGATRLAVLALTISLVLATELINTAVEATVDLATEEYHPLAKVAKDAAAGAVLISSIGAVVVGIFVFAGNVFSRLSHLL